MTALALERTPKNHSCNLHAPLCGIFCRKPFGGTLQDELT
ncbi:DUF6783 domain-containing protein [Blautia sp. HCP3S3_H10_1]